MCMSCLDCIHRLLHDVEGMRTRTEVASVAESMQGSSNVAQIEQQDVESIISHPKTCHPVDVGLYPPGEEDNGSSLSAPRRCG